MLGEPADQVSDEQLAELYAKHLSKVSVWLAQQANFSVLYVDYKAILVDPEKSAHQINQFLDNSLDQLEMVKVVDPNLYRQRK